MLAHTNGKSMSAVFITFSGNCKKALTFYQSCFGGILRLQPFEAALPPYMEMPMVSGSLHSDKITIYGSDLVHKEGRNPGNYISIFLFCNNSDDRRELMVKLATHTIKPFLGNKEDQKLIEITDVFDVRWVLAVGEE